MISKRRVGPAARALVVVVSIAAAVAIFGGCGSDPNRQGGRGSQNFPQVSDGGLLFTPADLAAIGYKTSKRYSVDGLPGATSTVFGFWAPPDGDPIDYEVRFYASHTDAVNLGTALAEEGTGRDAALTAERATYKEGVNDRRTVIGRTPSGSGPKYADYAIFNNLIMLCAGADSEQSLERCGLLARALERAG